MRWKLVCLWYKYKTIYLAGKKLYELEMKNPVTVDMLITACEDFTEFTSKTAIDDIKDYLFLDYKERVARPKHC
jgi:hypothetical protein